MSDHTTIEMYRSLSDAPPYSTSVAKAVSDSTAFDRFRSDPGYQTVLEHVSYELGSRYALDIVHKYPDFLHYVDLFKQNDFVGGPTKYAYPQFGEISPTTLRYIHTAARIQQSLGGAQICGSVAEIGGGYGGQYLVLDRCNLIDTYTLFDLPIVLELQKKFIESFLTRSAYNTTTLNQFSGGPFDFVLSCFAFSELPRPVQEVYMTKVISRSKAGYMVMNSGRPYSRCTGDHMSSGEIMAQLPNAETHADYPADDASNYVITWGP